MKRLTEAWFEFKGIDSRDMGIYIAQMPTRGQPGMNVTRKSVAGRDGTLAYGDRTYKDISVSITCDARDATKLRQIAAWLTGSGPLRFSDEPDLIYDASIDKEIKRASIIAKMDGQRLPITWTCHPFKRIYPDAAPITITASGTAIQNPGTAPALPKLEISGSGDFAVTIGMQTLFFTGIDGGIIVDSELGDALTADAALLANDHVSGDLFEIQPGTNTISWTTGGEETTGTVKKIVITPRWRCI